MGRGHRRQDTRPVTHKRRLSNGTALAHHNASPPSTARDAARCQLVGGVSGVGLGINACTLAAVTGTPEAWDHAVMAA
jgi:hypothetical protein